MPHDSTGIAVSITPPSEYVTEEGEADWAESAKARFEEAIHYVLEHPDGNHLVIHCGPGGCSTPLIDGSFIPDDAIKLEGS